MPFFKTSQPARRGSAAGEVDAGPDAVLSVEIAPEGCRAREVKTRSKTRPTGAHPSFRMKRMVHWESSGERNAIRLLDIDPTVELFSEQPCVVRYRLEGMVRRHYPDLRVKRGHADGLYEVKTKEEANRAEVLLRTHLLENELPRFGFTYKVLVSEDLERQPRLRNAEFLLRHGREEIPTGELEEVRRYLSGRNSLSWGDFRAGRGGPITMRMACRLVLEGVLCIDIDRSWDVPGVPVGFGGASSWGAIR